MRFRILLVMLILILPQVYAEQVSASFTIPDNGNSITGAVVGVDNQTESNEITGGVVGVNEGYFTRFIKWLFSFFPEFAE